ncbi:hypothetical protein, partial [Bifidobacterium longum]|uniref:hypothetical protein n=1 Tax=Bifidobacterium longum TaxID=216816 RepID=UPI0032C0603C
KILDNGLPANKNRRHFTGGWFEGIDYTQRTRFRTVERSHNAAYSIHQRDRLHVHPTGIRGAAEEAGTPMEPSRMGQGTKAGKRKQKVWCG